MNLQTKTLFKLACANNNINHMDRTLSTSIHSLFDQPTDVENGRRFPKQSSHSISALQRGRYGTFRDSAGHPLHANTR